MTGPQHAAAPRLVAFDLDDTLAPSKSPLEPRMAKALAELLAIVDVCVISGGQYEQFQKQVIEKLPADAVGNFGRLHLMPTCGTQYYLFQGGQWVRQYSEDLTDDEKKRALADVEQEATRLGYWEANPAGPILEDRG